MEWIVGSVLFIATALVVVWQNSRLAVLFDLAYVLENAYRISLGQVPYRDFPFPYPPLTFLIQAALIKFAGRVFWHHVVYCALMSGGGTVLTWRIVLNVLRPAPYAGPTALILTLPVIVLGIYCVFPHPFYDPDCTFAVLLSLLLVQNFARSDVPLFGRVLVGVTIAIPVFIKQNVGLAFFALTCGALLLLVTTDMAQRRLSGYGAILIGALIGLVIGALLIESTAGLGNYLHWIIDYAASSRMPSLTDMLEVYEVQSLPISLFCFALGAFLLWWGRTAPWAVLSALLVAAPFAWSALYLLVEADPSERADRLLDLWPAMLVASMLIGVLSLRTRIGFSGLLPFILFGTINAAFMSQQLWGSTYAIWPLFIVLAASSFVSLPFLCQVPSSWFTLTFSLVFSVSLLIAGGAYVWSHERLDYAKLDEGKLTQATLPELKGLATHGRWIPDFEQLAEYVDHEIPHEDAILLLPDEDVFYYATGREPRFPILMFVKGVNPYAPEEMLKLSRDLRVRWLIVKHETQLDDPDVNSIEQHLAKLLRADFTRVKTLRNYDVYRRP